jgi:hypothetical protein
MFREESLMSTGELNEKLKDPGYRRGVETAGVLVRAADLVEDLLDARGFTRAKLAEGMGVSPAHITQVLAGDRNMTLVTLSNMLFTLGQRLVLSGEPLNSLEWKTPSSVDQAKWNTVESVPVRNLSDDVAAA